MVAEESGKEVWTWETKPTEVSLRCELCIHNLKLATDCKVRLLHSNQVHSIESFKRIVKQILRDQFIQEWQSRVAENSICCNYRLFKKNFDLRNI